MKAKYLKIFAVALIPALAACSSNNKSADSDSTATESAGDEASVSTASYVNLSTGQPVTIVKDTEASAGQYVYADSRKPIETDMLFVDVSTGDTLYGPSGVIVNNAIIRDGEKWTLDDTKIERDGDEIKIKSGNEKLKIDGDDMKLKSGDSKIKVDDGEEIKTKTPTTKEKIEEDGETTVKPR